jgi:hypothetical protein
VEAAVHNTIMQYRSVKEFNVGLIEIVQKIISKTAADEV